MRNSVISAALMVSLALAVPAHAQKSGQSISIVYGTVVGSRAITEQSNAAAGALLGGTIAYAASSRKSSSSKRRNAAGGALVGGVAANRAQGDRSAKEYTVETGAGRTIIISDQTEIVVGDCVVVENAGSNNANIRRVTSTYCDPGSKEVVAELADEMMEEAEECFAAKQELAAADTDASFDRAIRKVEILCNN